MLSMLIGEFSAYHADLMAFEHEGLRVLILAWTIGFGIRFGLHSDPDNVGQYIAYYLFIVLSVSRLRPHSDALGACADPQLSVRPGSHAHSSHPSICLWDASRGTSSPISISLSHHRRLQSFLSFLTFRRSLSKYV